MKKAKRAWQGEISAAEMPEPLRTLADLIGVDNTILLAGKMGGANIYIPKIDTVFRGVRDKKIFDEFNGKNYALLAKKYGVTERRIRKIIKDYVRNNPATVLKRSKSTLYEQQRLFW